MAHSYSKSVNAVYHCSTEQEDYPDCLALSIGWKIGRALTATRWAKGSILTFNGDPHSFPTDRSYRRAIRFLEQAASEWNDVIHPYVRFRRISDKQLATFQLTYRDLTEQGGNTTYATSFCPDPRHDSTAPRELIVYALSFQAENLEFMVNIFCHELGHVLGFRHENAIEIPEFESLAAVQFGPRNPLSVMGNDLPLSMMRIDLLDAVWARNYYAYDRRFYRGVRVEDVPVRLGGGFL
ncbi:zincin [Apiospora sp. TS-2023a]